MRIFIVTKTFPNGVGSIRKGQLFIVEGPEDLPYCHDGRDPMVSIRENYQEVKAKGMFGKRIDLTDFIELVRL